jgi:acylphosphatase
MDARPNPWPSGLSVAMLPARPKTASHALPCGWRSSELPERPLLSTKPLMALKQLQLVVRGRVQGVYFRASTQREAKRLGLSGWVKNRADGSVEVLAEGEEDAIRELHGWAQKGPSAARVDRVDTRWRSFTGDFADFRIVD